MRRPAWLALAAVIGSITAVAAMPAEAPAAPPAARWAPGDHRFVVELAADPMPGARQASALQHYVIGVAALPVSVVQPEVAFALPIYLLVGAPWQAMFNARAERLVQVLAEEPMPGAVIQALRQRWPAPPPAPSLQVTLRVAAYGLGTRSGGSLEAFGSQEELCLVAEGRLEIGRGGGPPEVEAIAIGPDSRTRDAPPPLCASMWRWGEGDGLRLRQARRELAELLAAFIVDRAEHRP